MSKWYVTNKRADFAAIGRMFGIDPVTARVIRNRGLEDMEDIRRYLFGTIEDLYDAKLLKDGLTIVDILEKKIKEGVHIRIIGDYDIDGVMSSFILHQGLTVCGAKVSVAIPNRMTDGYGLNIHLIEQAIEDGVDTIITCDNGIAAIDEIAYAKEHGLTVLVTDHHEIPYEDTAEGRIYKRSIADAIVNPHQPDCPYPYKDLCGAAVAWKVMVLLHERFLIPQEMTNVLLENVAFATVGDVMPLTGENRILVKEGIKKIRHTSNVGLNALIAQCGIEKSRIDSYHFGFVLGPCINAAGRLDTARRALELFLTKEPERAAELASELYELNEERKQLTLDGVAQAEELVAQPEYAKDSVLVLYLPEVHESIAGIIAGRIRERHYRPTFVLTKSEEGVKGSGRSIEEYSMYERLCECRELFTKFGGHPMAAGLSLPEDQVENFRRQMNEKSPLRVEDLEEKLHIDVPMPAYYVKAPLIEELELLAPFGKDNPRPLFAEKNLRLLRMWVLGKNQNVLRLSLEGERSTAVAGIFFGDIPRFFTYLTDQYGADEVERARRGQENGIRLSIVYVPKINEYQGSRSIQFEIKDYC